MKTIKQIAMLAFAALVAQCVWAATPIVVWDGDFKTNTKTGTNNDTYKLVVNGNTVADDEAGSSITIADTERKGVYINWSTTTDAATILVKYSGLTTDNKTYPMGLIGFSNGNKQNIDGLAIHDSSRELKAYWNDTYFYSSGTPKITMDGSVTKFALKYSSAGTHSRSNQSGSWETLYANSKIMGGGTYALNGAVVGGSRALSYNNMDLQVATGMQIIGIAIFNSVLSDDDIAGYYFPSEVAKIGNVVYTSLSEAITAAGSDETTITLIKSVSENVTIPENVTIETQSATALSGTLDGSGKIKVAALAENTPRFTFADTWSGTVEIAALTQGSARTQLMDWGTAKSKIVYKGLSGSAIWVGSNPINSTIVLDGNVEINNGSSAASYTLNTVTGSGDLTLASWGGCRNGNPYGLTYTINTLSDYTGTLAAENRSSYASGGAFKLVIGNIVKTSAPAYGEKVLSLTRTCTGTNQQLDYDISSTKLNGKTAPLVLKDDGVYLASAMIGETPYATLQDAADAAEDGDTIVLLSEVEVSGLTVTGKAVILEHNGKIIDVDPMKGTSIGPAINSECTVKLGNWANAVVIGDLKSCVALTANDVDEDGNAILNKGAIYTKYRFGSGYITYFVGKSITLDSDMTMPVYNRTSGSIAFCGKNGEENALTLELNGYTLLQPLSDNGHGFTGLAAVAVNSGYLTIQDTSEEGTGKIIGCTNTLIAWDYSDPEEGIEPSHLTLKSGTISSLGGWTGSNRGSVVTVYSDFVMEGGTIVYETANEDCSLWSMIYALGNSCVINGGTIGIPGDDYKRCNYALLGYYKTEVNGGNIGYTGFFRTPTLNGGTFFEGVFADCDLTVSSDSKASIGYLQVKDGRTIILNGGTYGRSKVTRFDSSYDEIEPAELTDYLASGYAVVKNEDGLYAPLPKTPDLEIKISEDGTITPSVTSEGTVVVVNQETLDETSVIPQTTGLYGVIVKNVAGKATGTNLIGVVKVQEAVAVKNTIAVAVPFTGATVENLLNTALLSEEDTVMAYVGGSYKVWELAADKTWQARTVTRESGTEMSPDASKTPLNRGQAVWVTTAGQVVTLGTYVDTEVEIELEEGHNLLGNTKLVEATPEADETEQIQLIGEEEGVSVSRYNKTATGWESKIQTRTQLSNGKWVVTETTGTAAPKVKPGRGYWRIIPAAK